MRTIFDAMLDSLQILHGKVDTLGSLLGELKVEMSQAKTDAKASEPSAVIAAESLTVSH
jgi:hypothetical protein